MRSAREFVLRVVRLLPESMGVSHIGCVESANPIGNELVIPTNGIRY
jgi:hypothetical protein